ncbi:MAG: hypothetical protein ABI595_03235 [Actinomycetota bacterium]
MTLVLALAISIVLIPTAARADGVLDQSQPAFSSGGGGAGTCETERLAQTFVSGLTGGIDRVDLHVWRDDSNTSADLHVQIQSAPTGAPSGVAMATGSVPLASIGTSAANPNFVSVSFDPPAKVDAGERYAIVVLESGLPCTQGYWWSFVDGLAYPNGEALSLSFAWFPFGGDNGQDFAFKTYVDTSAPRVDIVDEDTRLKLDGSVPVTVSALCRPGQQAFELDVSVQQGSVSGSATLLGPGLTPCDGTLHRITVRVTPEVGVFTPGAANVDGFLGVFDPEEGDLDLTDSATIQLLEAPPCRVGNPDQGTWFANGDGSALTDAIAEAASGDRLNIWGTCVGNYTIDRDLVVSGSRDSATPTTLTAGGVGRVLMIESGVTLKLSRLTITGGAVTTPGGGGGIAVSEGATVWLVRSEVIANSTTLVGGGIVNGGDLTVIDSSFDQNFGFMDGGGIYNYGELVLIHSRLRNNSTGGAGGGIFNEGSAVLYRSAVRFNRASNAGGILNVSLLTLHRTVVKGNTPDDCEGC